jgi:hypothetical protein
VTHGAAQGIRRAVPSFSATMDAGAPQKSATEYEAPAPRIQSCCTTRSKLNRSFESNSDTRTIDLHKGFCFRSSYRERVAVHHELWKPGTTAHSGSVTSKGALTPRAGVRHRLRCDPAKHNLQELWTFVSSVLPGSFRARQEDDDDPYVSRA